MPVPSIAERIEQAEIALDEWRDCWQQITDVRRLEKPTGAVSHEDRESIYPLLYATQGYRGLLRAFLCLQYDTLTETQRDSIERAISIMKRLEVDCNELHRMPVVSGVLAQRYADRKMEELGRDNEIYVPSGCKGHINIIRIAQEAGGRQHTYTIHDSDPWEITGHKFSWTTMPGGWKKPDFNRPYGNTVEEYDVKPGTNMHALIRVLALKKQEDFRSLSYKVAAYTIGQSLVRPARRSESDYTQRRWNCPTHALRVVLKEALHDEELFNKTYGFVMGRTSMDSVERALEKRLGYLKAIAHERQAIAGIPVQALDLNNYQRVEIGTVGDHFIVCRTKPGDFRREQLDKLLEGLRQQGVAADIWESESHKGPHGGCYLWIREKDMLQAQEAFASLKLHQSIQSAAAQFEQARAGQGTHLPQTDEVKGRPR